MGFDMGKRSRGTIAWLATFVGLFFTVNAYAQQACPWLGHCDEAKAYKVCIDAVNAVPGDGITERYCIKQEESSAAGYFVGRYIKNGSGPFGGPGNFHYDLSPTVAETGVNRGQPPCGRQCFGDPINAGTGNKYESRTDYQGHGDFPLSFGWTYDSSGTLFSAKTSDLILGRNRTHRYLWRVVMSGIQFDSAIYVLRPDGKSVRFTSSQSGWVSLSAQAGQLQEIVIGSVRTGWAYEDDSGYTKLFDAEGKLLQLTDLQGRQQTLSYSAQDQLASVVDSIGRSLGFQYGANDLLEQVDLPDGSSIRYAYNPAGDLIETQYPSGDTRQYLYDEAAYSAASGQPGLLTGELDEASVRASTTFYDGNGRATGTEIANGLDAQMATYQLSADGRYFSQANISLPNGSTRQIVFAIAQSQVSAISSTETCAGCTTSQHQYTYDAKGYLSSLTTNGVLTNYVRDVRGLITQQVDAANDSNGNKRVIQADWDAAFSVPLERRTYNAANALVAKSTWSYNARGQALTATQTDPATLVTRAATTTYCEAADITAGTCPLLGLVIVVNGARTDVADTATYTYYASDDATCASSPTTCPHRKGDLWKVADALGRVTETLAYDGAGRPLSVKDANGVITDMEYHPRGWLAARKVRGTNNAVETDDQITAIEYWPTGLVKKVTQPDGAFTAYTYDAAHRLTDIADNAGNTIHYRLDNAGNRTAEDTKDAGSTLRRTLSRVYNQLAQLQTAKDAYNHATGFTYDANGNTQTVTDALSHVTDNDYDPLNRLVRTLQDVGGIAAETKFEYDALDNLTQVTDPKGLDTAYQYNGFGDLTQLASPDTGITTYTYDSAGNRQTQTDARGITSTYSYDALNRLTGIAYPTTSLDVGYVYDTVNAVCTTGETFALGRLTQITDSSGHTQYCYDLFGSLVRKVQTTNGHSFELRYAYTKAGQLQAITYPDGALVDYVRDGQGRTTEVGVTPAVGTRQVLLHQATYHPFGPVASWTYGNGRTLSRPLNQNYQPTAVVDPATGGLSLGYAFDAVGNLSQLSNADQSAILAHYGYDALNRLTDVKDGPTHAMIEHYGYDATGNRTSLTNAGGTTGYTYPINNHRLTQVGATARSYDNAGNTTQIGGAAKEFVYNDANRMSQVKAGGMPAMNYQLNGRGEQVRKYLGTSNTYTVYDEAGRWIGDYDNAGNALQQAIWLDDLPVGLLASNQLKYLQPDHLGTPRVVIDPATDVAIWTWELKGEAFGNTVPNQDPDGNGTPFVLNIRFPGQRYDAASGLNYNYLRDGYEPPTGRYSQSDPIGLTGGINTYAYVSNRPLDDYDPTGLEGMNDFPRRTDPITAQRMRQRDCANRAFWQAYGDMKAANWKKSDKYFHCRANCEATKCGPAGYEEACEISDNREAFDQLFKGDSASASAADQVANKYGREGAMDKPNQSCQVICAPYRPKGLPSQY